MTKKQKETAERLCMDTDFGNGHVFYMVTGFRKAEIGEFIDFLGELDDFVPVCKLHYTGQTVSFHTHEKYRSEIQGEISEKYPDKTVYWNDCWDEPEKLVVMQKGKEIEPCRACKVVIDRIEENGEPGYFDIDARVVDNATGTMFSMGGGMLDADQKATIEALAKAKPKSKPKAEKKDWIVGIGGNEVDDVILYKLTGTEYQIKREMIKMIKEDIGNDPNGYDYGTDKIRDLTVDGGGIYGYTVFNDYHMDYRATPLAKLDNWKEVA